MVGQAACLSVDQPSSLLVGLSCYFKMMLLLWIKLQACLRNCYENDGNIQNLTLLDDEDSKKSFDRMMAKKICRTASNFFAILSTPHKNVRQQHPPKALKRTETNKIESVCIEEKIPVFQ